MNFTLPCLAIVTVGWSGQAAMATDASIEGVRPESVPVAFTLDDLGTTGSAPVEKTAKALLQAGVPEAYGFVNGSQVHDDRDNEESVRLWVRAGYQIGNHTFSHEGLDAVTAEFYQNDIVANEVILKQFAAPGANWHWFRYPHLSEGDTLEKKQAVRDFLDGQSYRVAQVTVDYPDWLFDAAYGRCLKQGRVDRTEWLKALYLKKAVYSFVEAQQESRKLFGRDVPQIFLVHYSRCTGEVMPELLAGLKAHGARFITLEQAQSDPVFDMDPGIVLPSGENFLAMHALSRFPPTEGAAPAHRSTWKAKVKAECAEETERIEP
jgi:peptidoglycan/xylan/chitin deacetylase (PgdA/CDA1 family)